MNAKDTIKNAILNHKHLLVTVFTAEDFLTISHMLLNMTFTLYQKCRSH